MLSFYQHKKFGAVAAVFSAAVCMFSVGAHAEFQISTYNGYSYSLDTDFDITQPGGGGTDMTLHDVESDGKSFSFHGGPPYYGGRVIYWIPSVANLGFAVDYTHAKIAPDLNQAVTVSGTRDGGAVSGQETLNQTVSKFEFTDGLNLLTFNALYRLSQYKTFVPYVGAGVGLSIPHVEFRRANSNVQTFEYQIAGVAAQVLAGVEWRIWRNISAFGEYKLSYAQVDGDLAGGGSLETDIWTNHFIFGVSYRFGDLNGSR